MKSKPLALLFCALSLVIATSCTDQLEIGLTDSESSSPGLAISLPARILDIRQVDRNALFAEIRVNNELFVWTQDSEFRETFTFAVGDLVTLDIVWFEILTNGTNLPLTAHNSQHVIERDTTLAVSESDYSAANFDDDNDGFNNLIERESGSDPLDPNSTPNSANVRIPWVDPTEAPEINGLYDSIWDRAQFFDTAGELLSIDNLMIDQGADRPDGLTEFRWYALHDDTFLYIFVEGENVDRSTPVRDSSSVWQDDNINLYLDGNNSQGDTYDGFDDRHILIPLLTSPSDPTSNSTVFVQGENSADIPAFEFATCLCTSGTMTWEIKIPMAEFNIIKDREFGFDVQLDDDIDGGARDAKWGWFHPSRDEEDSDNTWTTPSYMGAAVVQ